MIQLASTLPQNVGSGYVAAAYIVFLAIVLIYVAIMAVRLSRMERRVRELRPEREKQKDSRKSGVPHPSEREHERV